mmetsp:Transcript_13755/g.43507  ORF Transcript_13755/g.43507 Transcript_13755/m.43507 type:complete len:766 (+) Transcript_13755:67-2364(+)
MPKQNSLQAAFFGKKAPIAESTPEGKSSPAVDAAADTPAKRRKVAEEASPADAKAPAFLPPAPASAFIPTKSPAGPAGADSAVVSEAGPLSIWGAKPGAGSADLASPSFEPSKRAADAPAGKSVPFSLVSEALVQIEDLKGSGKGSRKTMTIVLSNVFRFLLTYRPQDLVSTIYLLSNKVAPDYEGVELGVGDGILVKTISEVFGRSDAHIKTALANGDAKDLGEVALQSRVSQKVLMMPPKLSIDKVFSEMRAVAHAAGKDSQKAKKEKIEKMLAASRGEEAKFIVRILQSKLRVGIQIPTVLQAIAYAFVLTAPARGGAAAVADLRRAPEPPSAGALEARMVSLEAAVKQAFSEMPNFDRVIGALMEGREGTDLADVCHISLGIPVKPMLAKPSKGIREVAERLTGKRFTGEWKYDGERAQIHVVSRDQIRVYSRNSENMTEKYPDVIKVIQDTLCDDVESCIIDSELVAYDQVNGKILPFQILTTRGRKNIVIEDIKVNVCVFAFDCMLCNGQPMVTETLEVRRKKLWTMLKETTGKVKFATYKNFEELKEEEVQAFLDESIAGSCEGLMLKTLSENATYEPSKRSLNWLKLKKDYLDGVGDSIDVVPIGAFYGKGKRTGAYGAFLLAIYDPENEEYQTVCKAGTGFSDEDLSTHYEFFKTRILQRPDSNYNVTDKVTPDVWLEACQVWEIKAADLSISPVHTSAMGIKADGKGIGLRFPRFLRIRDDKSPEESTGPDQIVEMFESQASIGKDGKGGDDFDF